MVTADKCKCSHAPKYAIAALTSIMGTIMDTVRELPKQPLDFLWVELTSRCNLRCIHCYADAGPSSGADDLLDTQDYASTLTAAATLGCRKVQFIGGEPTLSPSLPVLIRKADALGYEFIEVFTNGIRMPDALLSCFVEYGVSVATSFYCDDASIHDRITQHPGSHAATVRTLGRLLGAGLDVRAGIIVMEHNATRLPRTMEYLRNMGIANARPDRVRSIGRATDLLPDTACSLGELCGNCWRGTACVSPDGSVFPCIMAKLWPVGSLRESRFAEIAEGGTLHHMRERIYNEVWLPTSSRTTQAACKPGPCNPDCSPNCSPCYPYGKCDPQLFCGPCGPGSSCNPQGSCNPCGPTRS